jgi:probable HAF family extracellular repeat protein
MLVDVTYRMRQLWLKRFHRWDCHELSCPPAGIHAIGDPAVNVDSGRSLPRGLVAVLATASIVAAVTVDSKPGLSQKPRTYSAFEVGSLDPGAADNVRRLNASGEIVGGGLGTGRGHQAFVLRRSGREDVTFQHRRDESTAFDLNDAGEVVGEFNGDVALRPFRKSRGGRLEALATLTGDAAGSAIGINSHGEAVGYSSGPQGIRAVWWTRAGAIRTLSGLPGADETRATTINDRGDIAGVSGPIGALHAVAWPRKGALVDLGALPGDTTSSAEAINSTGDVVGFSDGPSGTRAVLWTGGQIHNLGVLPGGDSSRARAINKRGEVVGTSTSHLGTRAFIWTAGEGMLELNLLVRGTSLILTDATSINDKGEILVIARPDVAAPVGHDQEDHELPLHVVVLTPLP